MDRALQGQVSKHKHAPLTSTSVELLLAHMIAGTCLLVVLAPFFFLATRVNKVLLLLLGDACDGASWYHGALLLPQRPPLHKAKSLHLRAQSLATPAAQHFLKSLRGTLSHNMSPSLLFTQIVRQLP